MKIEGLKVLNDKGWKADDVFTGSDGKSFPIPANHKFVCTDENGDVVNVSVVVAAPLTLKVGAVLPALQLVSGISRTQFGFTFKGVPVK